MARNQEKAGGLLNRWTTFKSSLRGPQVKKRPRFASECTSLPEAEQLRRALVGDITTKITEIQNAQLGEHRIRELNDEINKLLKQKYQWELQIVKLGGKSHAGRTFSEEGKMLPDSEGYIYFGAAKDLPGVRELFVVPEKKSKRKSILEMHRNIDIDYYGIVDDKRIREIEDRQEKKLRTEAIQKYDEQVQKKDQGADVTNEDDSSDGYESESPPQ
mmetsp:Transcript_16111/g.18248  ORF Transcript_16111/g.18248 Transcript_16111/m.18248 type:complete len:216 (+) Transcript_16111:126-773(+)